MGKGYSMQIHNENFTLQIDMGPGTCESGSPLGLENLKKWEGILQSAKSQGILNRLEKSGKIQEFQTNIICYFFSDI